VGQDQSRGSTGTDADTAVGAEERARRVLRLAVERGLVHRDVLASAMARESRAGETGAWQAELEAAMERGVIDQFTIDGLARAALLAEEGVQGAVGTVAAEGGAAGSDGAVAPPCYEAPDGCANEDFPVEGWDRYELVEFLGQGGMGRVFKARDPRLGRNVALKFLRSSDPGLVRRFVREAQVQARVDHDAVCKVYEVGEVEGHSFIAMQYVSGGSLKEVELLLSVEEKVEIIADVGEALHAAHRMGLIHRDVKPANIMVERDPDGRWRPFVVDFGIARDTTAQDITRTGGVVGTPAFASPEQLRENSEDLDVRADVYSLGASLYWFLTGRSPFEGRLARVMAGGFEEEPDTLRRHDPGIPRDLETIVLKCLEASPDRRYASARAVARDLRRFLAGDPIEARRASIGYRLARKVRKHRGVAVALTAALAALLAVVGFGLHSSWQARHRSALAQRLVEQVKEIEALMRVASMMPLHDRRPEQASIRRRLVQIESEIAGFGALGRGPGHYALGRGQLVLQEYGAALDHLQRAWDEGYRHPAVSYALGVAMGKLYEQELQRAEQFDSPELRTAYRREAEARLKTPALRHLRAVPGLELESPSFVEGLIAFYEGRLEDAQERARAAFEQAGWLYEAKQLEADILVAAAGEAMKVGDMEEALRRLARAGEAYGTAIGLARSEPGLYEGDCARWIRVLDIHVRTGEAADDAFEQGLRACRNAITVDPDRASGHATLSRLYWRWADHRHDLGEDPTEWLEAAVSEAERAIELDPKSVEAHCTMGGAKSVAGLFAMAEGRDPRPSLLGAVASLERAIALQPGLVQAFDDMGYALERLGKYEMGTGGDPLPFLERAVASYRRAISLEPGYHKAHNNLGIALWRRAYFRLHRGEGPEEDLEAALSAYRQAIALNPAYAYAYANLGIAHRTVGLHLLLGGRDPNESLRSARERFDQALDLNPRIHWCYPEKASVELLAVRWSLVTGRSPGPFLDAARQYAERALELNPRNAVAFRMAGEVQRWRAEWLMRQGRDPAAVIRTGLGWTDKALAINPAQTSAMLTRAALLLARASAPGAGTGSADDVRGAQELIDRALEINPLHTRDAAPLRRQAEELLTPGP